MTGLRFEQLSDANHDPLFRCNNGWIDFWFNNHSLHFDDVGRSRTYVLLGKITDDVAPSVLGFFSLRAESQYLTGLEDSESAVMDANPDEPVPLIEIAYLARSTTVQRQGIGGVLLVEALRVIYQAAQNVGVAGAYLSTTNQGKPLYTEYGFSAMDNTRMYLPLRQIEPLIQATTG